MSESARIFTLAEATLMLPWLRERLLHLRMLKQERDAAIRRLAGMTPAMRSNGSALEGAGLEERLDELAAAMQPMIEEIIAAGAEIKDIDRGLVDFPALRGDRVVYLCWLVSEAEIAYWHELDTGFTGRKALEE